MKKRTVLRRIACMTLTCAMILHIGGLLTGADDELTDATVQSYEEQRADLLRKQQQTQEELEAIQYEQANAWDELGKLDEQIGYNTEMKRLAANELDAIGAQIQAKTDSIADTKARIERQEKALRSRMVQDYMEGDASLLELLLDASSLTDLLVRAERVSAIMEHDKKVIGNLRADKAQLEEDEKTLEKAEEEQVLRVADFENAIRGTQDLYDAKQNRIGELMEDENEKKALIAYQQEQERQLNAQLEAYLQELIRRQEEERRAREAELQRQREEEERRLREEAEASGEEWNEDNYDWSEYTWTPEGYGVDDGTRCWPLEPGVDYYVSSEFGGRELWGEYDDHLGIDLACACGTEIRSYAAGQVVISDSHWSYGNYVLVDHGNGFATLYAHMNERVAYVGQAVQAGDVLGYVGMTGSATGYHLHFETRENGEVVNPRNYLVFPW